MVKDIIEFVKNNPQFDINKAMTKCHNYNQLNSPFIVVPDSQYLSQYGKKKMKLFHQDGSKRVYYFDKKNGVYLNKKKTQVAYSNIASIMMVLKIEDIKDLDDPTRRALTLIETKYADKIFFNRLIENITGNHYRNQTINVPKSVYGMK